MISIARRAEKRCVDALLADDRIKKIYGSTKIFQGFVAPNTQATIKEYILLRRISSVALDRVSDGTKTNSLRRVRLQVDVSDIDYAKMVERAEIVMDVLETNFPSSIDGDTYGTDEAGQAVFNVCSIDVILTETEV